MTKPIAPVTTDAAIAEHPWPRTDAQRVEFANLANAAWKAHKATGGKKDDDSYPLLLVSFDAWKAAGSPVTARKSTTRATGMSGAGRKRLNDSELRALVIELGKDGGSVKPSMILRRIRAKGHAASLAVLKKLVPELVKAGTIKEPVKPAKPVKATKASSTKSATQKAAATRAAKKATAKATTSRSKPTAKKPDPKKVAAAQATAAKKMGRPAGTAPKPQLPGSVIEPVAKKQVTPIPKKATKAA